MGTFILALLHSLMFLQVNSQQNQTHTIKLGSVIYPTKQPTSWSSPSGLFAFGFYPQNNGFLIGIWLVNPPENVVVWTANRDDPAVTSNASLELTTSGNLVLRNDQGEEKSVADVPGRAESASLLDSGNLVLYDGNSSAIWQSFDFPTDTLLGGQNLSAETELVSSMSSSDHSSGRFLLVHQTDGNLVAYPVYSSREPEDSYWNSYTPDEQFEKLCLDQRGRLFLYGMAGSHILVNNSNYRFNKTMIIYRATLDADGIFRLYSHHFRKNTSSSSINIEWSVLQDQCDVHGFCGFNSYCSRNGSAGFCSCYHGFSPRNSSKFFDCFESISDVCGKDLNVEMKSMENLLWGDYPYLVEQMKKQDCRIHCENDCNCRAALYENENQRCEMYKLPLRYRKKNTNISTTSFFKVVSRSSKVGDFPSNASHYNIEVKTNDRLLRILSISLGSIACFCSSMAIASVFMYRHRLHSYRRLSDNGNLGLSDDFTLRSFSYCELEKATKNFQEELGRGNFGAFYRGVLPESNKTIAVKRLETDMEEGEREFKAEIAAIGQTNHRNLVRLLGFCVDRSRKLLVYEYISNGSVADFLFKGTRRPIWKDRVKIAFDVARAILYLHEECEVHIIHGNIKPQNILLDESWTEKLLISG